MSTFSFPRQPGNGPCKQKENAFTRNPNISLYDEHHRKRKLDATVAAWEKEERWKEEEEGPKGVDAEELEEQRK